jgi:hypothetical protein
MDLRETLKAAMNGDDGPAGAAPEPVLTPDPAPEPVQAAAPEAPIDGAAPAGGPDRDEHGRFKPKDTPPAEAAAPAAPAAPEAKPESVKPEGKEPQPEAIRVPPSLPAAVKAKFASLDPDVRDAFVSLETSVQNAKAEWGKKGERLNRFDEILGPHVDRWRLNGLDEYSGIQALIAAQSMLDRNPVEGLVHVARSYGLTPAHIAQAFGLSQASAPTQGAEGHAAPTVAPDLSAALQQHLAPVLTQVQTLQQQLSQSQQQSEAAKLADAQRQIDAFANDPANMYFANVSDDVFNIIAADRQAGGSMSLQEAYDRAVWANPTTRPLLLEAQNRAAEQKARDDAEAARKAAEKAAREKAQSALHAGGSVTGSPTPGSGPPNVAPGTVRDQLRAAMQEHGAI